MEMIILICEKIWIFLILGAFFICLAKGWLKKGFYLTKDQAEEQELMRKSQEDEKKMKKNELSKRAKWTKDS